MTTHLSIHPFSPIISIAFMCSPAVMYIALMYNGHMIMVRCNDHMIRYDSNIHCSSRVIGGLTPISLFGHKLLHVLCLCLHHELLGQLKLSQVSVHLYCLHDVALNIGREDSLLLAFEGTPAFLYSFAASWNLPLVVKYKFLVLCSSRHTNSMGKYVRLKYCCIISSLFYPLLK